MRVSTRHRLAQPRKLKSDAVPGRAQRLQHRRRVVEHEQPVPRHQHAVEEQHAVLLVEHLQRMAPRAEPARHRLARQDFEAGRVVGDGEGEHATRVVALGEGGRQRDIDFVAVRRRGRKLLAAGDDDALAGLLDDVEHDLGVLGDLALLVLGLLAAVDLRVAERVGQEEVVVAAVFVIFLQVLAEIAFGVLDRAVLVLEVQRREDVGREDVGAAAELAPGQLVPQFAVAALSLEVLGRAREQPRDRDAIAAVGVDAGHLVAVLRRCSANRRCAPARRPCP